MALASVAKQIAAVRRSAETMHAKEKEVIGTASIGDVVRQGDLYLVCIDGEITGKPAKNKQLAPGTTQGSRHVANGDCRVIEPGNQSLLREVIHKASNGADIPVELLGPVVECKGATVIEHPEHGHKELPAGSTWAVAYQRAYAEEVRRVQD